MLFLFSHSCCCVVKEELTFGQSGGYHQFNELFERPENSGIDFNIFVDSLLNISILLDFRLYQDASESHTVLAHIGLPVHTGRVNLLFSSW